MMASVETVIEIWGMDRGVCFAKKGISFCVVDVYDFC